MARTRRAVLAMGAASLTAVAGCLGGGNDNSNGGGGGGDGGGGGGGDGGDGGGGGDGGNSGPFPEQTDVTEIFFETEETIEIPAGEFKDYEISFENGGALKYDFTVTSGPAIDVLLIRDGEFAYFEEGHKVNYNSAHTVQEGSEGSSSARISSGSYHLTFDNSEMGRASPPTPTPTEEPPEETATDTGTDSMGTETEAMGTETEMDESGDDSGGAHTATIELTITAGR